MDRGEIETLFLLSENAERIIRYPFFFFQKKEWIRDGQLLSNIPLTAQGFPLVDSFLPGIFPS